MKSRYLYQKCGNCNQTAYLKAKEKYDAQREKLAGRYKTKTAMYEALMFLLIWYSVSTTLFQIIRSKIFISDCVVFFETIATFIQTIAGRKQGDIIKKQTVRVHTLLSFFTCLYCSRHVKDIIIRLSYMFVVWPLSRL